MFGFWEITTLDTLAIINPETETKHLDVSVSRPGFDDTKYVVEKILKKKRK